MRRASFDLKTNDHRDGFYTVIDVIDDETWGDVICVESKRERHTRNLTTVVNHRDKTFREVCSAIIAEGAIDITPI